MRGLSTTLFALAAAGAVNAAVVDADYSVLLSRQEPGTPQYDCHFDCGTALAGGRLAGHCTNATWTGYYESCLDCALDFDIWRYYGSGVSTAAEACGLSATPSPSGDDSDNGAGEQPTATNTDSETGLPPTTTTAAESGAEETDEPAASTTATTGTADAEDPRITEPPATTTGAGEGDGDDAAATTSIATGGAPRAEVQTLGQLLGVGAIAAVFGGLMGMY